MAMVVVFRAGRPVRCVFLCGKFVLENRRNDDKISFPPGKIAVGWALELNYSKNLMIDRKITEEIKIIHVDKITSFKIPGL